ncbi:MAG: gliding motility-associated C-terminal domain-containing protein, partial [Bacteroidia bacterium]|nr:gliding motility-associated C-terminal domain-containing protein [Bacteroidia bacterium]
KFRVKVNPDCVMEVQLFVYDRWGEKVFEASTADAASVTGWDGTFNGKALDNAVFVWYLNITLTYDPTNQIKQKGNVSLIR